MDLSFLNASMTANEHNLSMAFEYYWGTFGAQQQPGNGDPESPVQWVPFSTSEQSTLILDVPNDSNGYVGVHVAEMIDEPLCEFWDSLNYDWLPN